MPFKGEHSLDAYGEVPTNDAFFDPLAADSKRFYFVFPEIPGVTFHGTFVHAAVAGLVFVVVAWVVELVAIAISAMLAVGTLGLALVILIPAWLLGFWILPAVGLKYLAVMMPETLSFTGWTPVLYASLPMLVIGVITSGDVHEKARGNPATTPRKNSSALL